MHKVARKLRSEKGLQPFGSGGQTRNGVDKLHLGFLSYEKLSTEEARELLIEAVDTFVLAVNENKQIRQYLKNDPFEANNVEVVIYFQNSNGTECAVGELTIAEWRSGTFQYKIRDSETNRLRVVFRETYEEALDRPEVVWRPEPLLDLSQMLKNGSKIGILKEEKNGSFSIDSFPKKD